MSLPIANSPAELCRAMRTAIEEVLPKAEVHVEAGNPGHFQIRVKSEAFSGKSVVQQQQLVYGAIAHLMRGDNAPVHAIDRLQTSTP